MVAILNVMSTAMLVTSCVCQWNGHYDSATFFILFAIFFQVSLVQAR